MTDAEEQTLSTYLARVGVARSDVEFEEWYQHRSSDDEGEAEYKETLSEAIAYWKGYSSGWTECRTSIHDALNASPPTPPFPSNNEPPLVV